MLAMTKGANKIKQLSDAKHAILRQKYRRPDVFFFGIVWWDHAKRGAQPEEPKEFKEK